MRENIEGVVFTVLLIALLLALLIMPMHGAVSTKHGNSIGVPMYTTNPLMYLAGSISERNGVNNVDNNLQLSIKPVGTYMLFDETVLLCGLPMDKFQGITEPFVLTYERKAHRSVQGIGCHNLLRVDSIKPKEKQ